MTQQALEPVTDGIVYCRFDPDVSPGGDVSSR